MNAITVELTSPGAISADAGDAKLVAGPRGEPGAVYVPQVTDGVISWTNDAGLANPAPADITGPQGEAGPRGEAGAYFTPAVDGNGNLSWSNNGGLTNPATVNIRGPAGAKGDTGATGAAGARGESGADGGWYVPAVDAEGNLSWSASKAGMPSVAGANIRGPAGETGEAGPQGPAGPKGDTGSGLDILGQFASLEALTAAVTAPQPGDNYYVGSAAPYNIYTWGGVNGVMQWIDGGKLQGAPGADGGYYTPGVDASGVLSWTPSAEGMPPAPSASIAGPQGVQGPVGPYYTPSVDSAGNLSWTNTGSLTNPEPVNIRGPAGEKGETGAAGPAGAAGEDGGWYVPGVDSETGALSWTASKAGMPAVAGANIRGPAGAAGADGADGEDGGYYIPGVDADGLLSWTASRPGMSAVSGANIRGPAGAAGAAGSDATINGVNALTLSGGTGVEVEQDGSVFTINVTPALIVHITGAEGSQTASASNAEIYAAYQSGLSVFAEWNGTIMVPQYIDSATAMFGYVSGAQTGSAVISGGSAYAGVSSLKAGQVGFTDTSGVLSGANNVQDAFDALLALLGLA